MRPHRATSLQGPLELNMSPLDIGGVEHDLDDEEATANRRYNTSGDTPSIYHNPPYAAPGAALCVMPADRSPPGGENVRHVADPSIGACPIGTYIEPVAEDDTLHHFRIAPLLVVRKDVAVGTSAAYQAGAEYLMRRNNVPNLIADGDRVPTLGADDLRTAKARADGAKVGAFEKYHPGKSHLNHRQILENGRRSTQRATCAYGRRRLAWVTDIQNTTHQSLGVSLGLGATLALSDVV